MNFERDLANECVESMIDKYNALHKSYEEQKISEEQHLQEMYQLQKGKNK